MVIFVWLDDFVSLLGPLCGIVGNRCVMAHFGVYVTALLLSLSDILFLSSY